MIRKKFLEELPQELAKARRFPWCVLRYYSYKLLGKHQALTALDFLKKEYIVNDIKDEWDALQEEIVQRIEQVEAVVEYKESKAHKDGIITTLRYYADTPNEQTPNPHKDKAAPRSSSSVGNMLKCLVALVISLKLAVYLAALSHGAYSVWLFLACATTSIIALRTQKRRPDIQILFGGLAIIPYGIALVVDCFNSSVNLEVLVFISSTTTLFTILAALDALLTKLIHHTRNKKIKEEAQ